MKHFFKVEDIIEYAKENHKDMNDLILYVTSPRTIDGELHNCGDNYIEGYFLDHTPFRQSSEFKLGMGYHRRSHAEDELKRVRKTLLELSS